MNMVQASSALVETISETHKAYSSLHGNSSTCNLDDLWNYPIQLLVLYALVSLS
ncbi:MAG: hypothetical protein H0U78_02935 [Rickettsiaceae bacterium]|nr:hypothetical protein [Rickettsiaceae bacterium]